MRYMLLIYGDESQDIPPGTLDCADIDEAVAFAGKIPGVQRGSVEVRPILDLG